VLDQLLIVGRQQRLRRYLEHYNLRRPHRSLAPRGAGSDGARRGKE
jgi:hypothetical protein